MFTTPPVAPGEEVAHRNGQDLAQKKCLRMWRLFACACEGSSLSLSVGQPHLCFWTTRLEGGVMALWRCLPIGTTFCLILCQVLSLAPLQPVAIEVDDTLLTPVTTQTPAHLAWFMLAPHAHHAAWCQPVWWPQWRMCCPRVAPATPCHPTPLGRDQAAVKAAGTRALRGALGGGRLVLQ